MSSARITITFGPAAQDHEIIISQSHAQSFIMAAVNEEQPQVYQEDKMQETAPSGCITHS